MPAPDPRRVHPRRPIAGVDLFCYRASASPAPQIRQNIGNEIVDISQGGARIRVREVVSKGETITLELKDRKSGESFRARGEVRWCSTRPIGTPSSFFLGVQFSEVYTPMEQRDRFTTGQLPKPQEPVNPLRSSEKRAALRFAVDDYLVTLIRQGTLSTQGLKRNLARQVINLSRTGAQLSVSEVLEPGLLVHFTIHLNKFADGLETAGEVRWCRAEGGDYLLGLRFVNLPEEKRKMIDFMTKWFSTRQKKVSN
jgi:hypothetical protein